MEALIRAFGSLPNFVTFVCSMFLIVCCVVVASFYLFKHCCCPTAATPRPIRRMRTQLGSIATPIRVFFTTPPRENAGIVNLAALRQANLENLTPPNRNLRTVSSPALLTISSENEPFAASNFRAGSRALEPTAFEFLTPPAQHLRTVARVISSPDLATMHFENDDVFHTPKDSPV